MEIGGAQFGALRRFDHAAVADESHPFGAETRRRLAQLRGERLDVRRVAGEQFDRQRAPVGVAQEADHDLALARLAIPVVAEGGERVLLAFQISAGHVVEKHIRRRRRLSLSKQPGLDIRLMLRQPIEIGVEIVFVEADHAERRARRVAARQAHGRQARALVQNARDDLPSASLPCRSEPRAATMPRSRASCDNSQTAPTEGPWTNSSALSAAAATIRLALRHKADLAGMVAAAAERALE